ncbi:MAG TPA: hypothetical protein DDY98_02950 [Ruminococcaceae bacterium]|nr:hypothetical protein [Oscillospiraceae bacterium]
MDNHTFDEGIDPGGLRSRNEIQLLVCYLLSGIDEKITRAQLCEISLDKGLANYFEINQAISDLTANGSVCSDFVDCEEYLSITEKGRSSSKTLESQLPKSIREKAINAAIKMLTLARSKRENTVEVEKLPEGGFNVTFCVSDPKAQLMRLTVFVADEMQVETVKNNFYEDPVKLYSGIIASLTV